MTPAICHVAAVKADPGLFLYPEDANRLLSVSRMEKVRRLLPPAAGALSLAAELALLTALYETDPGFRPPARYEYAPGGAPFIPGGPFISLSHSGEYALAAACAVPIGIDIEGPARYHPALARKCLTNREQSVLSLSPFPEQAFRRCWVAKEAYVKFTGEGLKRPFGQVNAEEYTVEGLPLYRLHFDGHEAALCAGAPVELSLTLCRARDVIARF